MGLSRGLTANMVTIFTCLQGFLVINPDKQTQHS